LCAGCCLRYCNNASLIKPKLLPPFPERPGCGTPGMHKLCRTIVAPPPLANLNAGNNLARNTKDSEQPHAILRLCLRLLSDSFASHSV